MLQERMGGELDLLVSPLGSSVLTSKQAASMDATEVPIAERVSGLRASVALSVSPRYHSA
jgi:hypothetical protein